MQQVRTEERGHVLLIVINRPEAKNAINKAVANGLADAFRHLDESPALRVGVLAGEGPDFCAGMDLKAFARGELPEVDGKAGGVAALTSQAARKPLIAAVEGHAVAGGFELALACDLLVASESARFGLPEVRRGLVAAGGGALRLTRRLPYFIAMRLLLTGETIGADVAARHGLLSRLVPTGEAMLAALALADEIASNAPLAVVATKAVVTGSLNWPETEGFELQMAEVDAILRSDDALEGARAFAEKRPPRWTAS